MQAQQTTQPTSSQLAWMQPRPELETETGFKSDSGALKKKKTT